jgi:hypothetical protein
MNPTITTNAADGADKVDRIPLAKHHGKIGSVDCYVLEDGRCVLSKRTALAALGDSATGSKDFGRNIERLSKRISMLPAPPVFEFRTPDGKLSHAIDDESFSNIITAYVDGLVQGKLHPRQIPVALRAYDLQKSYAKIGLRAHILSVAGAEPRTAVQRIRSYAERLLRRDPREYSRRYSRDFFRSICDVYGWQQDGDKVPPQMAAVFGKLYRLLLGRTGHAALRALCPSPEKGNNQHQYFADVLDREMPSMTAAITYIARKSGRNVPYFWSQVEEFLGVSSIQTELPLSYSEPAK